MRAARCVAVLACAMALLGSGAPVASAAPSISAGVLDEPVVGAVTRITLTGNVDGAGTVAIYVRPAGGLPCNQNPTGGTQIFIQPVPAGPFNMTTGYVFAAAGSYVLCAYVEQTSTSLGSVTSTTVTVRPAPLLTVTAAASVPLGQPFQVVTTTQTEATHYLYLSARLDTGTGCPPSAAAAQAPPSFAVISASPVTGGPATDTRALTLSPAGRYLLCGYLEDSNPAAPPRAASTTAVAVVGPAPPPPPPPGPCVVPPVIRNELVAVTRARLLASSCTPGAVRYVPSSRFARGTVYRLAPDSGTTLPAGTAITLYVSTGAPCIVPKVPKSRSLTVVKRRVKAANCTVGKVTRLRSRKRKRGQVIGLSPGVGKRLSPRATVRIIVSSGRPRR